MTASPFLKQAETNMTISVLIVVGVSCLFAAICGLVYHYMPGTAWHTGQGVWAFVKLAPSTCFSTIHSAKNDHFL